MGLTDGDVDGAPALFASIYPSNTLRFVLPAEARNGTIAALTISSDDAAVLSLQQVDVLRES